MLSAYGVASEFCSASGPVTPVCISTAPILCPDPLLLGQCSLIIVRHISGARLLYRSTGLFLYVDQLGASIIMRTDIYTCACPRNLTYQKPSKTEHKPLHAVNQA